MRQAQLQEIQARHNAGQGPAAFVDTRTLNGQNNRKPKDKNLRVTHYGGSYQKGGGSSSGSEQGFAVMPAAAAEPDVPPMAPPSFNDILGQIKKAPQIGTNSRPRDRTPARAAIPRKQSASRDPETAGRANALGVRSKMFDVGAKRKAEQAGLEINPFTRRKPPKPEGRLKGRTPKPLAEVVVTGGGRPPPPPPSGNKAGKKMAKKKKTPPPVVQTKDKPPGPPPPPPPGASSSSKSGKKMASKADFGKTKK